MKKNYFFILLFIIIVVVSGCKNEKTKENIKEEVTEPIIEEKEEIPKYIDVNNTPISFYTLQGNKLVKLTEITKRLNVEEDIGLFQIFPSKWLFLIKNQTYACTNIIW